jgi:hypothetical protein
MTELVKDVEDYIKTSHALIGDINVEHVHNDIEHYFNMTPKDLDGMDKGDCVYAQYFIIQFILSLTKKINRIKWMLAATEKEFARVIAPIYNNYNSYNGAEVVRASACMEYPNLKRLDDEILKLQSLIQEWESIITKAEKLSAIFRDLSFSR